MGEQAENMQSQGSLRLDTEILQKEDTISTSLCDRFGIHMYSREFLEKEEQYREQQEKKNDEIFENVMHEPERETSEQAFQTVLHADTTEVIKAEYQGNQKAYSQYMNGVWTILGALAAGVVLFIIEKRMRRKRNENHHNDQEREEWRSA